MKRHHIGFTALFVIIVTALSGCAGCSDNNTPVTPVSVVIDPAALTVTVVPTTMATIVPAEETETVTPTPMIELTVIPDVKPTNTPILTAVPETRLLDSIKMGDNIWYDFYDDGMLVVRGTGMTRGFKDAIEMHTYLKEQCSLESKDAFFGATSIVIDEGVKGIGEFALGNFVDATKIFFSSTLEYLDENALYAMGYNSGKMDYINLDVNKVAIANTAFAFCGSPEKIPNSEKYTITPTPTPAPTVTPLPDPNKPRKYATKQMGDNVIFEFWDNGYLYVKGTGATWDKEWNFGAFERAPYKDTGTIIVEEGVTYLGDHVFHSFSNVTLFDFPKTLTDVGNSWGSGLNTTIKGYYKGKRMTIKTKNALNPYGGPQTYFRILEDIDKAIEDGYEITIE